MPLTIPDETLKAAGLTENEMKVEIACRLYDAGKLQLWQASQLSGMTRSEFEAALMSRQIAVYRPTIEDLDRDLLALKRLGI